MTEPAHVEVLSYEECLDRLRAATVGRIAVVEHEFPIVLPVNFRLVELLGRVWVAVRTRPGNVLDRAALPCALEVDEIDLRHHRGWSVLVRGTLEHVDPDSGDFRNRFDPEPWLAERDAWLVLEPFSISGRQITAPEPDWAFHVRAYL